MDRRGSKSTPLTSRGDSLTTKFSSALADNSELEGELGASTTVGTLTLDPSLCLQNFSSTAAELFSLQAQDIGRRFDPFAHHIDCPELIADARRALQGEANSERKVQCPQGCHYELHISPAQSGPNIDSVVITVISSDALTELEREFGRLSKVVMEAADPIMFEDAQGIIFYANSEAIRSYGWTREELLGSHVGMLIPAAEVAHASDLRSRCRQGEQVRNIETTRQCKSGAIRTVLLTLSLINDEEGTPTAIASIAKDITARKEAEAMAREAVERRDQFLAMLSHELRNPLGAVLNATYVLDDNCTVRKSCKNPCQVIQRQTHQMSRLLDDLLDVTRVTQGKIEIRPQPVQVRELIETVLPTVMNRVQERKQTLEVNIDPRPMTLRGDTARLQQVQVNLLTNAIKYTPAGGKIWLRAYPENGDIVLTVRDNGEGIPATMLESVFDLFVQARATLARSDGGMGVGLTLVKQLVELHGGSVSAHSDGIGQGTEFIVRLPAFEREAMAEVPKSEPLAEEHCGHILIVEDNADSREMLQALLEIYGYQVDAAPDGHAGLALLQNGKFDLALVDIGLPGIDGYEVARVIRRDPKHANIRLVALTGYGGDADRAAVKAAGFDDHLIKPLQRDALDKVLPRGTGPK